jgi:hypothetical protein
LLPELFRCFRLRPNRKRLLDVSVSAGIAGTSIVEDGRDVSPEVGGLGVCDLVESSFEAVVIALFGLLENIELRLAELSLFSEDDVDLSLFAVAG